MITATVGTPRRAMTACDRAIAPPCPCCSGATRELDGAPDLLVGRLGLEARKLPLEALELARETRAAEQRQVPQLPEPLAEAELGLTRRHCGRAVAGGRGRAAGRAGARSRRRGRSGGSALRGRSPRGASRASSAGRRAGR